MNIIKLLLFKHRNIITDIPDILFNHFEYFEKRAFIIEEGKEIYGTIKHGFIGQDDDVLFIDDDGKRHFPGKIYIPKREIH